MARFAQVQLLSRSPSSGCEMSSLQFGPFQGVSQQIISTRPKLQT